MSIRPLLRSQGVKNYIKRFYHQDKDFKAPTLSDLPVPNGSWKAHYDAQNTKYNIHLLIGLGFAAFTLVTAKASGLVYLNYYPPSMPEMD